MIYDKDFVIKKEKGNLVLYYKVKGSESKFKKEGYFTDYYYIFKRIYNWRKHKKYPFKESSETIRKQTIRYRELRRRLKYYCNKTKFITDRIAKEVWM